MNERLSKPANTTKALSGKTLAALIARILEDKKAADVTVIDLAGKTAIADFFVVCSASSVTRVKSLAENLEETLLKKRGVAKIRAEGLREGRWVALDYNYVIVHIFHKETRDFYRLERLWL